MTFVAHLKYFDALNINNEVEKIIRGIDANGF